jgi:methylphosphotriester-DNA--protein-cysteine methyltransferase
MKTEVTEIYQPPSALNDTPKERNCLRCKVKFWSSGFGERVCRRCKGLSAWRNSAPANPGTSRNR